MQPPTSTYETGGRQIFAEAQAWRGDNEPLVVTRGQSGYRESRGTQAAILAATDTERSLGEPAA